MTVNELLIILGYEQVATAGIVAQTYATMHPEFTDIFLNEDLPDFGYPPNLEVLIEAKPDLVIGPDDLFIQMIYNQIADTIPMVVYDVPQGQWRERLTLAGDLLNASEQVEGLFADYDARVAELQAALGEDAADIEVSLVRTFPGQIGLVVSGITGASVLEEVGLSRPEGQRVELEYVINEMDGWPEIRIQEEELLLADGDVIFLFGAPEVLTENPLWQTLSAVKAGHAYDVGYYWWGESLLSAHDMLDDLFAYVAQIEPALPNPFEDGLPADKP